MKKPIDLVQTDTGEQIVLPTDLNPHLYTFAYRYLQPRGWFNDYPCDDEGIMPWMTYPAIDFLKDILSKENKVFEYGSGYSTLFFNNVAGEVVSVEHDPIWADRIKEQLPNAQIHLATENSPVHSEAQTLVNEFIETFPQIRTDIPDHDLMHGLVNNEFAGYASTIYNYPKGHFDIIVLDGMARSLSGVIAVERIADNGIIILDNSDRWHYNVLQQFLVNRGYGRIDFWGPGFNNYSPWCTSFFIKNLPFKNNRLERTVKEGKITI